MAAPRRGGCWNWRVSHRESAMPAVLLLLLLSSNLLPIPSTAAVEPFSSRGSGPDFPNQQGWLEAQDSDVPVVGLHDCTARQVHLALTGDPTEMIVSWVTHSEGCKSKLKLQAVNDNDDDDVGSVRVKGNQYSIHTHVGCNLDSEILSSSKKLLHIHHVVLSSLEPGQKYRYKIHHSDFVGEFTAAPKPNSEETFTFLAFGDLGEPYDRSAKSPNAGLTSNMMIKEVEDGNIDMVLHVGDLAYAHGHSHVWNTFMEQIEPMASRIPYMISIGNFEYDYKGSGSNMDPSGVDESYRPSWWNGQDDSGGECGLPCALRFQMPGQQGNGVLHGKYASADRGLSDIDNKIGNPPFWYHFAYGSAHFVVLSSEHDLTKGSRQQEWLKDLLDGHSIDRDVTPWLIVGIHRPLYAPYPHRSNRRVARHMRQCLEPIFSDYKVDIVVSGHIHSYLRSCPVFNWECVEGRNADNATNSAEPAGVPDLKSRMARDRMEKSTGDEEDEMWRFENDQLAPSSGGYGFTQFVIGTAGHHLSGMSPNQPDWVEFHRVAPGYGRFTVYGSKKVKFEFVDANEGKVVDSVEIYSRMYGMNQQANE